MTHEKGGEVPPNLSIQHKPGAETCVGMEGGGLLQQEEALRMAEGSTFVYEKQSSVSGGVQTVGLRNGRVTCNTSEAIAGNRGTTTALRAGSGPLIAPIGLSSAEEYCTMEEKSSAIQIKALKQTNKKIED